MIVCYYRSGLLQMPQRKVAISDTVSVTADGRTVVNVRKLMEKKHIRDMMRQIRAKTITMRRATRSLQTVERA